MYEPRLNRRDRLATFAMVAAIHVALAFALVNLSPPLREKLPEEVVEIFDVTEPPPPEEEVVSVPVPAPGRDAEEEEEGAASPENLRSEATPVASPRPPIQLPIPPPMPVSPTPREGSEPTQGAAEVPGPGTGAGGVGTGTGSGGSGRGTGGGGSGGYAVGPQLLTPVLRGRDFPRGLLERWPRNTPAFLRLRIDANGSVLQCLVDRGSGNPAIDAELCRLVQTRFRFRPAIDRDGRAVAGWTGYVQPPPR